MTAEKVALIIAIMLVVFYALVIKRDGEDF